MAADGKLIGITTDKTLIVRTVDGKQRQRFDRWVVTNNFGKESRVVLSHDWKWFADVAKELTVYEVATAKKRSSIAVADGTRSNRLHP